MRLAGRVTDWNDDKGFGFVTPHGGGARAFVHINAFQRGSRRPVDGDLISYLAEADRAGRLKARQIRHAGARIAVPTTPSRVPRAAIGLAVLAAAVAAAVLGVLPALLVGASCVASALSYLMYGGDKRAARADGQRTPEASLHLVDLLGGWPGALVAQQRFRHKTAKPSFQRVFVVTVVLNLVIVAWCLRDGAFGNLAAVLWNGLP
jgi:uncharacterized membrane protein YsdA (DUF1294 family)/cold shock CspA family protein